MSRVGTLLALAVVVVVLATAASARRFIGRNGDVKVDNVLGINYKELYFTQDLDHFNFANNETYQQRYLVVDQYWDQKGPIFFYTGNEGDIVWFMQNTGFMFDIAPTFNALLIFGEHRYYGKSLPFGPDHSFDLDKVGWLTSTQTLADYSNLLTALKAQYKTEVPVVAFGGSYGGMLAGWFRMRYPNIVVGAIAASAPIICGDVELQYAYNTIVSGDFNDAGCGTGMRSAFSQINTLSQSSAGLAQLTSTFSLCSPLQTASDASAFVGWIENALTSMPMVDYPYASDFLKQLPAWPVQVSCDKMNQAPNVLAGLAEVMQVWYNDTGSQTCFNISDDSEGQVDDRAWDYQSCTEMVLPIATNGVSDFFPKAPFDADAFKAYCAKRWNVTPRFEWVGEYYGGADISGASQIVWTQGMLDPWRGLGLQVAPKGVAVDVVLIDHGAHHLDLRSANPADPQSVINARKLHVARITEWIANA